jgi:hypothetical protein
MAGFSFEMEELDDLYTFYEEWSDAEHEFFNEKIERKRKRLHELIGEYTSLIGSNTFPTDGGRQTVPPEWEYEQPERFGEVVRRLHGKAESIVDLHQDLIRTARRKLGM